jgi:hypothetical protein
LILWKTNNTQAQQSCIQFIVFWALLNMLLLLCVVGFSKCWKIKTTKVFLSVFIPSECVEEPAEAPEAQEPQQPARRVEEPAEAPGTKGDAKAEAEHLDAEQTGPQELATCLTGNQPQFFSLCICLMF